MDYNDCIDLIFSANARGVKLGHSNMQEALQVLGNPHLKFPSIHVAGTNGKGSVVTKIARALTLEGYRVGLYTSPHISCYRERIVVDGEMISEEDTVCIVKKLLSIPHLAPTFFEYTTLLAFCYFAEQGVDFAVLETGLGGRLDATNVCNPILSVITSISLEHTAILGNSVEEIALEKAGIIKTGVPVLIGPHVPKEVILQKAYEMQAPFYQVTDAPCNFELENQEIAKKALQLLQVGEQAVLEAIQTVPPCRFQQVDNIILDVAHNPDGIKKLLERLRQAYPSHPVTVVCGFSQDKDVASCARLLAEEAVEVYCVQAATPRAMPAMQLAHLFKEAGAKQVFSFNNLEEGIQAACRKQNIILICGSFFIMSQVRYVLGIDYANRAISLYPSGCAPSTHHRGA